MIALIEGSCQRIWEGEAPRDFVHEWCSSLILRTVEIKLS